MTKGLAKLGNIVAETLLRMQMFPNLGPDYMVSFFPG